MKKGEKMFEFFFLIFGVKNVKKNPYDSYIDPTCTFPIFI
jgi:hypothetical protein